MAVLGYSLTVDGYPELPYVSIQKRVAKGWWDNQERKNFNETVSRSFTGRDLRC